ncbi:hypothetical protein Goklo_026629 [Gossypium klotzschianum]|uniref:Uncharacterized protein n=1 Tax=Gossypium klotzschianum TaxID=34286 RepID=A0A7J8TVE3_9ROSI|nr:hypothetical protein [Gossypium klotzschianum]
MTRGPSTSTRHCSIRLSPITENSPLQPPIKVWHCLSPSVADHPLGLATDHRLAYGVLAVISSCCSPPKGRFLRITYPSATGNTTSQKVGSKLSFVPRHNLYPCASYFPGEARKNRKTHIGFRDNQARNDDFHHVKARIYLRGKDDAFRFALHCIARIYDSKWNVGLEPVPTVNHGIKDSLSQDH